MYNVEEAMIDAIETLKGIREHYEAEQLEKGWDALSRAPHPATIAKMTNTYLEFLHGAVAGIRRDAEREAEAASAE